MKLELFRPIFEKFSNFMKIIPVGAELFHEDRRTDMKFSDAPKMILLP